MFFVLLLNFAALDSVLISMPLLLESFFFLAIMKNWFHTIMVLMLLELMMLIIFFLMMYTSMTLISMNSLFLFSTFMVIEASLGMSIMTLLTRNHGNDFLMIF